MSQRGIRCFEAIHTRQIATTAIDWQSILNKCELSDSISMIKHELMFFDAVADHVSPTANRNWKSLLDGMTPGGILKPRIYIHEDAEKELLKLSPRISRNTRDRLMNFVAHVLSLHVLYEIHFEPYPLACFVIISPEGIIQGKMCHESNSKRQQIGRVKLFTLPNSIIHQSDTGKYIKYKNVHLSPVSISNVVHRITLVQLLVKMRVPFVLVTPDSTTCDVFDLPLNQAVKLYDHISLVALLRLL
jgi:hypothetical protein